MENNWLTIENQDNEVVLTKCSKDATGKIVIPDGVTRIGKSAFYCVYGVTSIVIPNSVTYIGETAFSHCQFASLDIPNSVVYIGPCAFQYCKILTTITIPNSMKTINREAFAHSELKTIVIPKNVKRIAWRAFYWSHIETIIIPNSVEVIESEAFLMCEKLTDIKIPNSVTEIPDEVFSGCKELRSVEIPKGVTSIGDKSFYGCINLESVFIPKTVTKIGTNAFGWCESLHEITVEEGNPVYDSRNNCNAIIETMSNRLIVPSRNTIIPLDVTTIVSSTLQYALSTRKIPSFIKIIENDGLNITFHTLDFESKFPKTNNAFEKCEIEELRINVPRKLAKIPSDINTAVLTARKGNGGRVLYAAPELCQEESEVPGYIKVTMTKNDEIVDINTKYIVSVEPDEIERYNPITGSIITCATNGVERLFQIRVYEPCDMVLQKIEQSLSKLGQQVGGIAGLLDRIEILCKNNN